MHSGGVAAHIGDASIRQQQQGINAHIKRMAEKLRQNEEKHREEEKEEEEAKHKHDNNDKEN